MRIAKGADHIILGGIYPASVSDTLHIEGETQTYVIFKVFNRYSEVLTEMWFTPPAIRDYENPQLSIEHIEIERFKVTNTLVHDS